MAGPAPRLSGSSKTGVLSPASLLEHPMGKEFKRTRLWVNGPFQLRLLVHLIAYFLLYIFIVFHIGFFYEFMVVLFANGSPDKQVGRLYVEFLFKQTPLLLSFAAIAPAILYDMLKFSHRVAGPLYRCRNVTLEMAAG